MQSKEISELVQLQDDDIKNKYIVFRLAEELYAAQMMSIKEVIKNQNVKLVPYMVSYFKGVINLRGQIVSIIDLREKFNHPVNHETKCLVLIVEVPNGILGVMIDDLVSVAMFEDADIEKNPNLQTKVPLPFFEGIAKYNNKLVSLVNISECITHDDMKKFNEAA